MENPKCPSSHISHCDPVTPGLHIQSPLMSSHCRLVEPNVGIGRTASLNNNHCIITQLLPISLQKQGVHPRRSVSPQKFGSHEEQLGLATLGRHSQVPWSGWQRSLTDPTGSHEQPVKRGRKMIMIQTHQ